MGNGMRNMLLTVLLAAGVLLAKAGEYSYLVFTNTSGTTTALTVSNLSATVSGSTLVVTNDDGTVNFTLTDLAAMQFSMDGSATALENVINGNEAVSVYSITGVSMGNFSSMLQAAESLPVGAYVIKQGVNTQAMVVR